MPDCLAGCDGRRFCGGLLFQRPPGPVAVQAALCGDAGGGHPDLHLVPGRVFFYLKLALAGGLLLASPVIFYQIWRFVAPGLYLHEKKVILPFTLFSTVFFLGGAAFGYFVVFPPAFKFLLGYSTEFLDPMPAVKEYFSLCLRLLIAFGVIFELPIFMVLLAKMGIVNVSFLNRHRKYAILLSFVIAAILTPTPDVVNQLLMAVPLMVLYELSIGLIWLFARKTLKGFEPQEGHQPPLE